MKQQAVSLENVTDYQILQYVNDVDIVHESKYDVDLGRRNTQYYFNCACSFDIEVSSFYSDGEKCSLPYLWGLDINGLCIVGRDIQDFSLFIDYLKHVLPLHEINLICYVHNLAYEFQFIRSLFTWDKVFAREARKPIYAKSNGIIFKCSYILSGYSLAKVADNLISHNIKKLVGDLDYDLIRTPETPITEQENEYHIADLVIVQYYIEEAIERNGDITKIPLTQTGYVRKRFKEKLHKNRKYYKYIRSLTIDGAKEYEYLKRAFQGGFTHASAYKSNRVLNDITSIDFASSYPAVMCSEKYPASPGKYFDNISYSNYLKLIENVCVIAKIKFKGLRQKLYWDTPISKSKAVSCDNASLVMDNGRVTSCNEMVLVITEVDFNIYKQFYEWDSIEIIDGYWYMKNYLPKEFLEVVYGLYADKTLLKGVEDKEAEYMHSKQDLNSCYGMSVTDIVSDEISFTDDWYISPADVETVIDKNNRSRTRFLFYPWGVYVTAYARKNIFSGIVEFAEDYCYSDTDSIKAENYNNHLDYIRNYNEQIREKLATISRAYGFNDTVYEPKPGKLLGAWDFDGHYDKFKTLGAKRYMAEENGEIILLTVAGLNKKMGKDYISKQKDPFKFFQDNMKIPAEYSGRLTHTYIDEPMMGTVVDYMGNSYNFNVASGIHMERSEYSLSITDEYLNYILTLSINNAKLKGENYK